MKLSQGSRAFWHTLFIWKCNSLFSYLLSLDCEFFCGRDFYLTSLFLEFLMQNVLNRSGQFLSGMPAGRIWLSRPLLVVQYSPVICLCGDPPKTRQLVDNSSKITKQKSVTWTALRYVGKMAGRNQKAIRNGFSIFRSLWQEVRKNKFSAHLKKERFRSSIHTIT